MFQTELFPVIIIKERLIIKVEVNINYKNISLFCEPNLMDLGHQLSDTGDSYVGTRRILSNLLPDTPIIPENDNKKKRERKRKRGLSY